MRAVQVSRRPRGRLPKTPTRRLASLASGRLANLGYMPRTEGPCSLVNAFRIPARRVRDAVWFVRQLASEAARHYVFRQPPTLSTRVGGTARKRPLWFVGDPSSQTSRCVVFRQG